MFNNLNGLERTQAEFNEIVTAAGFKIQHVYSVRGLQGSKSRRKVATGLD